MARAWHKLGLLCWTVAIALVAIACTGRADPSGKATPATSAKPAVAAAKSSADTLPAAVLATLHKAGDAASGRKLVQKFECNRCHDGTGLGVARLEMNCVHCHQKILAGTYKDAPASAVRKWKKHVAIMQVVPSLESAGKRLKREWIARFLLSPHDLRPGLAPTMPRLAIKPAQARDIATYLTRGSKRAPAASLDGADAQHGRALMVQKACGTCHRFSGAPAPSVTPAPGAGLASRAVALAPDLRWVRDRYAPAALVAWLENPKQVKPDTLMPTFGFSRTEARDIAAYLLGAKLAPPAQKAVPKRLPLLTRRVTFEEVDKRVFSRTCHHCHGNPDVALGDGGPGNTGGFGFFPRGLDLSSYRGVSGGLLDVRGERHSIFAPMKDGTPRLVAALLARQREEAGHVDPDLRGMPLGLPALSSADIQIVASWVAQGRPR
jgi:cytochrome c2